MDGYLDANRNKTTFDEKNPNCLDINECSLLPAQCRVTELCTNTIGGYTCSCISGLLASTNSTINPVCINMTNMFTTTSPTTLKDFPNSLNRDNTGLVLIIVLPIIAIIVLAVLAASVCFCWYKV